MFSMLVWIMFRSLMILHTERIPFLVVTHVSERSSLPVTLSGILGDTFPVLPELAESTTIGKQHSNVRGGLTVSARLAAPTPPAGTTTPCSTSTSSLPCAPHNGVSGGGASARDALALGGRCLLCIVVIATHIPSKVVGVVIAHWSFSIGCSTGIRLEIPVGPLYHDGPSLRLAVAEELHGKTDLQPDGGDRPVRVQLLPNGC